MKTSEQDLFVWLPSWHIQGDLLHAGPPAQTSSPEGPDNPDIAVKVPPLFAPSLLIFNNISFRTTSFPDAQSESPHVVCLKKLLGVRVTDKSDVLLVTVFVCHKCFVITQPKAPCLCHEQ